MTSIAATYNILGYGIGGISLISLLLGFLGTSMSNVQYYLFAPDSRVKDRGYFELLPEYDFIIVGAGSAGSVLANRLSEVPDWKILLLEAGKDETVVSDCPVMAGYLQHSNADWQYKTEPVDNACLAFKNRQCNWPRGKTLGGSSVLNYMLYVRGNKRDYDNWEAMGNSGWSYNDVLPYFLKSEDNNNPSYTATQYHNTGGYLSVSDPPYQTPLAQAFVDAGIELGYDNINYNGAQQTGFSIAQGTIRNGQRCSTAKAFLRPVRNRPNLHVAMNAFVTKIIIDSVTKKATAVKFTKDLLPKQIKARKEVILSAGALGSPHLLMLSGVGPASELTNFNIPVIKDAQVGSNLQDHVTFHGLTFLINDTVSLVENRYSLNDIVQYSKGQGRMTIKGGVEAMAFYNTMYENPSDDYPNIQLLFAPGSISSDGGTTLKKNFGITDAFYKKVFAPINNRDCWSAAVVLLRPKSVGYLKLASANPLDKIKIYANYFADSQDVLVMREGVKLIVELAKTRAFQRFDSRVHNIPFLGCEHLSFLEDDYIDCMLRHITATIYHPTSTCKMGPSSDPTAVVDPQMRVYGIKQLRVVDASAMPRIVSGNTNAPVIMMAEKASDMIKQSYGK